MKPIAERIAEELNVKTGQVAAAIGLLDGGATVPFIARYRKEATGALDDTQLRTLETRLAYLRELEDRRRTILNSIREQGKLDAALEAQIKDADTKARLEDIYLPFKPKRRTKAQIARENGLEPLAEALLAHPEGEPLAQAEAYVKPDAVKTAQEALDGARAILVERFAEDAELIGRLREDFWRGGRIVSKVREGKEAAGAKFADYFDFFEPLMKIPSHRALALMRGEREEILDLKLVPDPEADPTSRTLGPYERAIAHRFGIADRGRPGDRWLLEAARWAWRTKIETQLAVDLRLRIWTQAEDEAVKVFAANLRDLLLAAPAGGRATIGLDPGFRTGVKVAVVDATGKIVDTTAIYPHEPQRRWDESIATLAALAARHKAELIAIGNGTASRETDRLAADLIARHPELELAKATVSEAGASVYSASAYAAQELPGLDVTLRGAASIARRLQDPLAELVKIDPKSIGVGQYQHDLSEQKLGRSLDAVVEDCVNAVGVDVNTASAKLLARVSGVGEALAQAIVVHRETHGPFRNRAALKEVPRLGAKAFELSAGFLRVNHGDQPLDRSGVHPEAYPVVRRILDRLGADIFAVIGNARALQGLKAGRFRRRKVRRADGRRHFEGAREAWPRPPPGLQDGGVQRGGQLDRGPEARHGPRRRRDQRRGLRRLRRRRRPPGRARPCLGDGELFREGPARGGQARRRRQGEGPERRRPAQAHFSHHAPWRPRRGARALARRPGRRCEGFARGQRRGQPANSWRRGDGGGAAARCGEGREAVGASESLRSVPGRRELRARERPGRTGHAWAVQRLKA